MNIFIIKRRHAFLSKSNLLQIFSRQAVFVADASAALYKMMKSSCRQDWQRLEREVKQYEIQGDAILAEFYEEMYERFVPDLDRDDIQTIAMDIDIFLDQINGSAKSLLLYLPERIDQQLIDLAQYIRSEADALKEIVALMPDIKGNFSAITMQCDRITELEHAADDAYEDYIGEIFRNEKNPIELMKYKNIAETLESTTDAAKKVSDHIRKLMLRYI
ncbi:MAG: DUF47 family protein [Bacteroidales bacterium]|nr:DUF47 family protein [Bacteroides sp.]MCM1197681.1 DUF47 family protein [Clostridium sp.]MCM1501889.1 DUF47 family protein [Bacteroidales bacterium]